MCCKNSEKNLYSCTKTQKRGTDADIFHHIAQYSICSITIPYTFAAETSQGIT